MVAYLSIVYGAVVKLFFVAAASLYAVVVLMRYRTEGPHSRLRLELREPVRATEALFIWLGVRVLGVSIRLLRNFVNVLLEASAQVGEWFIRRNPAVQESVRSRFLV